MIFDRDVEDGGIDLKEYHPIFIRANEEFKNLVLGTYRHISAHVTGDWFKVYRQLPAGVGVGLLAEKINWKFPSETYQKLKNIPFIRLSLIYPPLIYYTKSNKRQRQVQLLGQKPHGLGQAWIPPVGFVFRLKSEAYLSSFISIKISFPTRRGSQTFLNWPAPKKSPTTNRTASCCSELILPSWITN